MAVPSSRGILFVLTSFTLPEAALLKSSRAARTDAQELLAGSDASPVKPRMAWPQRPLENFVLLGVQTRVWRPSMRLKGPRPSRNVTNIGNGRNWTHTWLTRVQIFHEGLKNVSAKDPEQLVILLDMSDMIFGGCSDEEVLQYYKFAAEHGGAPVVFGASVFLQPHLLGNEYLTFETRRKSVLDAAGLDHDVYCRGHDALLDQWNSTGYSYLNAGFVMGPAAKVQEVFQGMLDVEAEVRLKLHARYDDQFAANLFMMAHENKATIDYTGRLILTDDAAVQQCHDGKLWVQQEGDHLVNTWTGKTACFVHGAGGGWRTFRDEFSWYPRR